MGSKGALGECEGSKGALGECEGSKDTAYHFVCFIIVCFLSLLFN